MAPTDQPVVVRIEGDPHFVRPDQLAAALAQCEARFLIVDLTEASGIDSVGIGLLIRAHAASAAAAGALVLAARNENLLRILAIAGVPRLIRIFDAVDDARRALAERAGFTPPAG